MSQRVAPPVGTIASDFSMIFLISTNLDEAGNYRIVASLADDTLTALLLKMLHRQGS